MARPLSKVEVLRLSKALLLRAKEARRDPKKFFEFVLREQTTREPIKVAPHQEVALKFMLDHDRSANMWAIGLAKTFTVTGLSLYLLGQDVTLRGAIVSATEAQAAKPLGVASDYILHSPELRLVFPELRPSKRPRDPWTQTAITVERPPGIPDASLIAYGMDGKIPGSRLNWIIVDDLLTRENTATKAQRDKVYSFVDSSVLSRLDPRASRVVFTNSAWHPEDVLHMLEKLGWPTLKMDILGNIQIQDDRDLVADGVPPWDDGGLLRPASNDPDEVNYRLVRHDPDPTNSKPLWFERFYVPSPPTATGEEKWKPAATEAEAVEQAHQYIETKRRTHLPAEFNRLFLNITRDDATAMCKAEWVEACKRAALALGHKSLRSEFREPGIPVFTGLDLAVSPGEESDDTAFFTFAALPSGHRLILDIHVGKMAGPEILDKIEELVRRYDTTVRVENNGAQDYIKQFMLARNASAPVKPHTTGRAKAHPEHGVPGIFIEIANSAWLIPNDRGTCHPAVQRWIDECLYYVPSRHTGDVLMASYFAREQAKDWGALKSPEQTERAAQAAKGLDLLSR